MIPQLKPQHQNHPFQTEHQNGQPTGHSQDDNGVLLPNVGLEMAEKVLCSHEYQRRDGALEDGGEDGGDHVGGVELVGPGRGDWAGYEGHGDGGNVQEDEEEADEWREEAEGESEEDEGGRWTEEDVVAD